MAATPTSRAALPRSLRKSVGPANTATTLINFENLAVSGATLAEPLVLSGFAFTSTGTSAGNSLMIEGTSSTPWPGNWPSNVLMAAYWGSMQNIAKSGGGTFNLNSLDLDSNGQAGSAVITGYSATGAILQQQIVNFSVANGQYATATANLGMDRHQQGQRQLVAKLQWHRRNAVRRHRPTSTSAPAPSLPPTTSLSASASSAVAGQPITFTATVSPATSGTGTPTGTVTFMDGAATLGTGTLSVVNGVDQATFTAGTWRPAAIRSRPSMAATAASRPALPRR